MAALPYIQLYVADYLADTMHLNAEEHGAYLLLIMNYWQTGKPIPKKRLGAIARVSNDRWDSVEDSLSEYFTETENGCWFHDRIDADLRKIKSKSEQASAAGRASAAKRALSKSVENKEDSNGRSNSVERKSNHTEKDTDTEKDNKKTKGKKVTPNGFVCFWDSYPQGHRKSKKSTLAKWNASGLDRQREVIVANIEKRKLEDDRWKSGYIPDALVFLNQERWLGDIYRQAPQRPARTDKVKRNGFENTQYSEEF